jgi:predicted TIM-barrel fold metal-dependent hydrolase
VHVGWLGERHFSPEWVVRTLRRAGVARWAFSSSSAYAHPWRVAQKDYEETLALAPEEAVALLWVTPQALGRDRALAVLDTLPFCGIKIHGHNGWEPEGKPLRRVWAVAQERGLPILLHTGEREHEQPHRFAPLLRDFPDVRVIQAHARPFGQALANMREFPNAWVDTSFMPNKYLPELAAADVRERVLFGTDFPATECFYQTRFSVYLRRRGEAVKKHGEAFFKAATEVNFGRVFSQRKAKEASDGP